MICVLLKAMRSKTLNPKHTHRIAHRPAFITFLLVLCFLKHYVWEPGLKSWRECIAISILPPS